MITRRIFLAGSGALAASIAIPSAASPTPYVPPLRYIATPEVEALIDRLTMTISEPCSPWFAEIHDASWRAYRATTYPRRWIGVHSKLEDNNRYVFFKGRRFVDDEIAFSKRLADGDHMFIDASPENYALVEALPQRAGLPLRTYLRAVMNIFDRYESVSEDRGQRIIYVRFMPTGHEFREISYDDQCRIA